MKMFKTTFQIPIGSEAGQCTIELPTAAFQERTSRDRALAKYAAFSSQVTTLALNLASEVKATEQPAKRAREEPTVTEPAWPVKRRRRQTSEVKPVHVVVKEEVTDSDDLVTVQLTDWSLTLDFLLHRRTQFSKVLETFAVRKGRAMSTMIMVFNGYRVLIDQTPDTVCGWSGKCPEPEMMLTLRSSVWKAEISSRSYQIKQAPESGERWAGDFSMECMNIRWTLAGHGR